MRTAAPIPRRFAIATGALLCALSMTLVVSGYGPQEPTDEDLEDDSKPTIYRRSN